MLYIVITNKRCASMNIPQSVILASIQWMVTGVLGISTNFVSGRFGHM